MTDVTEEEDPDRLRVRLYRNYAGAQACIRYFNPDSMPARAASLAEVLMWWGSLDQAGRLYPRYRPAMEAEDLWTRRKALRHARNVALHESLIMGTLAGLTAGQMWEDLQDPGGDVLVEAQWRSYRAHLAGKPIGPTIKGLARVFHETGGFSLPLWLEQAD